MADKDIAKFERPVFSREVMTDENKKKFDQLPGWQRHLIRRIIDHGNLELAAKESGVSRYVKEKVDLESASRQSVQEALNAGGITPDKIVQHLMDCLTAEEVRFDKNQRPIRVINHMVKLKTIEMICKLRGDFNLEAPKDTKSLVDLFEATPKKVSKSKEDEAESDPGE